MGLDLTLLPLRDAREIGNASVLCYNRLSFDRDYGIFGQLTECGERGGNIKPTIKTHPIPLQMWVETYEDEGINPDARRQIRHGVDVRLRTTAQGAEGRRRRVSAEQSNQGFRQRAARRHAHHPSVAMKRTISQFTSPSQNPICLGLISFRGKIKVKREDALSV